MFDNNNLPDYYGASTRGSMPSKGPSSKYNQCNINMLANQEPKASALFWYTQRYHTLGVMLRGPRTAIRHKETAGACAAIGDVRSELMTFCRLALGGPSRTAGLGPCFWVTARGSGVWMNIGSRMIRNIKSAQ